MTKALPIVTMFVGFLAILAFSAWATSASLDSAARPATCMPQNCFCETAASEVPRQPANTWSSLGFVIAGIVVAYDSRKRKTSQRTFALFFTLSLFVVGIGSAYYHSTLTFQGQVVDVLGMYLVLATALCYRWAEFRATRSAKWWPSWWLAANIGGLAVQASFPQTRRYVFAIIVLGVIATEWDFRMMITGFRNLRLSLALFATAFAIWIADITRLLCYPNSSIQGHAVWHLLGAAAAYCLYLHIVGSSSGPVALDGPSTV